MLLPQLSPAQNAGVRPMKESAIDFLFQPSTPWSGARFTDENRSRVSDLYINFSGGIAQNWRYNSDLNGSMWWIPSGVSLGYKLAPVHALELGANFNTHLGKANFANVNLSYLFNLTSYAYRIEDPRHWELMFLAGVDASFYDAPSFGAFLGSRVQYNISPSVGLYLEPKIEVVGYAFEESKFNWQDVNPSVSFGVSISPARITRSISKHISERKQWWESVGYRRVPIVEFKTNLLFDALTLVNFELEVPIGKRISIAGEWVFPWWCNDDGTRDSKRNRTQLLMAGVDVKYWFGNREDKRALTGWFAGVFTSGGLYDFERNAKGYQGDFYVAAGVSGGYGHTINKRGNLRMEYTLGFGYLQTDYSYYEAFYDTSMAKWRPVLLESGRYSVFAPLKAKVSLGWMISRKKRLK